MKLGRINHVGHKGEGILSYLETIAANLTPRADSPGSHRLRARTRSDQGTSAVAQYPLLLPAGW